MVSPLNLLRVLFLLQLLTSVVCQEFEPKDYCTPDESCWPSSDVFDQLKIDNPTMKVVQRDDPDWSTAGDLVFNRRVAKDPGATIYATTTSDVIAAVKFSQDHDMNLKIISSGHEFIGRNTADGCLQLSVARMNSISSDLNCPEHFAGCLTVGPGVWWSQAYKAADDVNRIVLGGAEPSVSVTGWALGGGHSPFSPRIGLGVDQIIELTMVLADLSVVTLDKDGTTQEFTNGSITTSTDTALFWAVRGGGGGTFGVVTSIKYRLHMPPNKFSVMVCTFGAATTPVNSFKDFQKELASVIRELPSEFGGYMFTGALCYTNNPCRMAVYATYVFTHWGAFEESQSSYSRLKDKIAALSQYQTSGPCTESEYDTYNDYSSTLPNVTYQSVDMNGAFMSQLEYNDKFIDRMANVLGSAFNSKKSFSATWIRLGGQTKNDSSGATAVNPLFRNAMWTIAYGGDESIVNKFDKLIEKGVIVKGQYYSECDDDLPPGQWQTEFWGSNYDRLLTIKREVDPENHFTCKQCVGSSGNVAAASFVMVFGLALFGKIFL